MGNGDVSRWLRRFRELLTKDMDGLYRQGSVNEFYPDVNNAIILCPLVSKLLLCLLERDQCYCVTTLPNLLSLSTYKTLVAETHIQSGVSLTKELLPVQGGLVSR